MKLDKYFRNDRERAAFVLECESAFEAQLDTLCAGLTARPDLRIIALSGPTCSGKTTTAGTLTAELEAAGHDVHLISIDDFFKERDVLNREAEMAGSKSPDYDSIKAIDFDLLAACTESILRGDPTDLPHFDFKSGKRSRFDRVDPDDASIFIFEGIQAIYPEVRALLGDGCASVHISVADDLEMNGVYFNRRDIRLMRRLVRDYKFRGAEPVFTFYLWRSVVMNEERSITPYESGVELRINSLMPYEVFLLKNELTSLLHTIPDNSLFYPKALEIEEKLSKLDTIPSSMVPPSSVLREFIGKD
ncbi:MAG: hypothetical protein IJ493_12115 [Clostridia bacterium]|nr:hypothetical protein [Clostridia bacterium]